jgi:hypothetical protein
MPGRRPRAFAALALLLTSAGWSSGAPAHVRAETKMIDLRHVRRMCCPRCRRRAMQFFAFQREGRYKALAGCALCGAGVEV